MALTLVVEQSLNDAGLIELFNNHIEMWTQVARRALAFVQGDFPENAIVRQDDLAQAMLSVIEVHEVLRVYLNENKIRGKHWKLEFAYLIVDRTWGLINGANE